MLFEKLVYRSMLGIRLLLRGLDGSRVARSLTLHGSRTLYRSAIIFILRCGPEGHDLLVAQRHQRIHLGGTAGGHITGEGSDRDEHPGDGSHGHRIMRADVV